jgi:hypothetical protein
MKNILFASILAIAAGVSIGTAAPAAATEAAAMPSDAEVGDGASFGRSVKFLGYAQTTGVSIQQDCSAQPAGTCVVPNENSNAFIERIGDEAVVRLPARAAHSLLCFTTTPLGFINYLNTSATRQNASATMLARWRIESEVLNDPTLINVNTGQPFAGAIVNGTFLASESFDIEPGAHRTELLSFSRTCNAGHLTRRGLVAMGLTEAQAREVFRRPITLRFGAQLRLSWAEGSFSPGFRIYGD